MITHDSYTRKGVECARWKKGRDAQNMLKIVENGKTVGLKTGNHCRNTGIRSVPTRRKPWCYTDVENGWLK